MVLSHSLAWAQSEDTANRDQSTSPRAEVPDVVPVGSTARTCCPRACLRAASGTHAKLGASVCHRAAEDALNRRTSRGRRPREGGFGTRWCRRPGATERRGVRRLRVSAEPRDIVTGRSTGFRDAGRSSAASAGSQVGPIPRGPGPAVAESRCGDAELAACDRLTVAASSLARHVETQRSASVCRADVEPLARARPRRSKTVRGRAGCGQDCEAHGAGHTVGIHGFPPRPARHRALRDHRRDRRHRPLRSLSCPPALPSGTFEAAPPHPSDPATAIVPSQRRFGVMRVVPSIPRAAGVFPRASAWRRRSVPPVVGSTLTPRSRVAARWHNSREGAQLQVSEFHREQMPPARACVLLTD